MACETHCCVLTRGEFFISDWKMQCPPEGGDLLCAIPNGYKKLGNVSSCSIDNNVQVLGTENEFNPLSDASARVMIDGVEVTIVLNCASKDNLYRALYGIAPEPDEGTHTVAYCFDTLESCDFFPFQKHEADTETVVVTLKDIAGLISKVLIVDIDYSVSVSGIEIINDEIVLGDGVTLNITYDYDNVDSHEINFVSQYQGYKSLYFKGSNFDGGGEAMFDAIFYKVLFSPIGEFDLITGDDFFTITLKGSVEKDQGSWYKITKKE